MNAFDIAKALVTFGNIRRDHNIADEHKRAIYADMLQALPPVLICPARNALAAAHTIIKEELENASTEGAAKEAREEARKGSPRRK